MRLTCILYYKNCEECGDLFARGDPRKRFCGRACYATHRSKTYRGENHPTYRGRVAARGYWRVWEPEHPLAAADGYVREHRKVLHDAGIAIPEGHHVHHINGDKRDNRLENLEVLAESEHHRRHIRESGTVENQYGKWAVRT